MVEIRPRETVILADDWSTLVEWYVTALGFRETRRFEDDYHYANLENAAGIQIGIGDAKEMGITAPDRSQNSVILQFEVENVADFFAHVTAHGGEVTFGPSFEEKGKFWFGGFRDPEGNPLWVVDSHCP